MESARTKVIEMEGNKQYILNTMNGVLIKEQYRLALCLKCLMSNCNSKLLN